MQEQQVMSNELQDFRGKLTTETICVLNAESQITGDDMQVIVRDVLHAWAVRKIDIAKITDNMLRSKGLPGVGEGTVRKVRR